MNPFRKMRTFAEVKEAFLAEKKISISPKTWIGYRGKLQIIQDYLDKQGLTTTPMHKISREVIDKFFVEYLAEGQNLDKPTCEKYYQNLKTLYQYALEHNDVQIIPFSRVPLPMKKEDMGAKVISENHLKCLLSEIKETDKQLFLASMMEYYCFIRPGREMRNMRVGDVDLANGIIRIPAITAKSKREDTVTMPTHLIQICKDYGLETADKSLYVFSKGKGYGNRPYSSDTMRYRFNKLREKHGLPKSYKWYSMKHTGATMLHQSQTVSVRELMDQMRHTNLSATQHYLQKHSALVNPRIQNNFPSPI